MEDNNNIRIAKNTLYLAIRMVLVVVVSLYTSRVILESLGVSDFGIYTVVAGFVSMFAFINNAMTTGVQRFYNFELGKNGLDGAQKVFNTSILTQLILAIIILVVTESVGIWYINNKMVIPADRFDAALWIFHFSVCALFINIMSVPFTAAIMAHEKMSVYAYLSVFDAIAKLLIAISLLYIPMDRLVTYGLLLLLVSIIFFLINIIYARYSFCEVRVRKEFHKSLFKDLLSFSGWNIIGKFAIVMKGQGLNMILNLFFGPVVNAARGIAFQVNSALNGFVSTVTTAVKPQMTQSYAQGNIPRTFHLMFSISKLCSIILILLAAPLCLEIDYVLTLWLGKNVPDYTSIFILLIFLSTFVSNLNAPVSFVVHATGKMKKYQIVTSLIEILMIPSSFIILKMGTEPWVVFIVEFVFVILGHIASLIILNGILHFSLKDYLRDIVVSLLSLSVVTILMGYICKFIIPEGFVRLVCVTTITSITCVSFSFIFVLTKREKNIVNIFLNKLPIRKRVVK